MAVTARDYYDVLGVARTASADEIKRAYRKQARAWHPDLHPGADRAAAAERFKEIAEAYEVLRDPEKRSRYDALGADWKHGVDAAAGGPGGAADPFAGDGGRAADDLFSSLFGRAGPGPRGRGRVVFPGADIEAELPFTVDEALHGGRRRVTIPGGKSLEVEIPPGSREGGVLRLAGQGEPGIGGGPPGDLYLRLRLRPDDRYRAAGDDLEMDLRIWPWQAVLGAELRVDTPDGLITLRIPAGSQSGRRLRLRGRGFPRAEGGRGDLLALLQVVVPDRPTDAEREAYQELARRAAAPPDRPAEA